MSEKYEPSKLVQGEENLMNSVYLRHTNCTKTQLKMSIGDPTFDGNLVTSPQAVKAHAEQVKIPTNHSYQRFVGLPAGCKAVANFWGRHFAPDNKESICEDNVVLTLGGSEAILHIVSALCDEGENILLPAPGFAHYQYVLDVCGVERRFYHMSSDSNWEVNLDEVRTLVDDKTKAILLNNPSNPCGSNWRPEHVQELLHLAEELKLVIIADEIYAGMVSEGLVFSSFSNLKSEVPRYIIGGTAKNFMAPGWRMGWLIRLDEKNYTEEVWTGVKALTMLSLGPNAVTQHALADLLNNTPEEYFLENNKEIQRNATYFADCIRDKCPGLSCASPQGALYIMVKVDVDAFEDFNSDLDFYKALEDEENIQVIPGTYLSAPGYFRACITRPIAIIEEVMERLPAFCERHAKKK